MGEKNFVKRLDFHKVRRARGIGAKMLARNGWFENNPLEDWRVVAQDGSGIFFGGFIRLYDVNE